MARFVIMSSATEHAPSTPQVPLVLALGNPILCDDRVGLVVARVLCDRLPRGAVELREASVGGLELLHLLEGWTRVLVIDAVAPGCLRPGEVIEICTSELELRYAPMTPHNAGFVHCLELGRCCGLCMPEEIRVFAIGVQDPYRFCESCTVEVEQAIPYIVRQIEMQMFGPQGCWPVQQIA